MLTDFGARCYAEALAVAIQPDGKIVVAGDFFGAGTDFGVARYNDDGSLDRSFGTGGRVVTEVDQIAAYVAGVLVQPDGKIVVGGRASVGLSGGAALVRYHADGALDPTFGHGGIAFTSGVPYALAIQRDHKLVTARDPFGVARFLEDGTLDGSFGRNGRVRTNFQGPASADEVVVQPDGKIVVAGTVGSYPRGDFAPPATRAAADSTAASATGARWSRTSGQSGRSSGGDGPDERWCAGAPEADDLRPGDSFLISGPRSGDTAGCVRPVASSINRPSRVHGPA